MTKHVIDHPRDKTDGARAREYTRIEREEGRHPASKAAHEQPADRGGARAREYARIERGDTEG